MRKLQEMGKAMHYTQTAWKMPGSNLLGVLALKSNTQTMEGKTSKDGKTGEPDKCPGHVVSVDQLVSPTPGLIDCEDNRIPRDKRYKHATVFVDQYSRHLFTCRKLHRRRKLGKKAFEAFARQHGVKAFNHHADNGIFKAHQWMEACQADQQGMTFAGVNAHHQNGHTERII